MTSLTGFGANDCWARTIEFILAEGREYGSRNGDMLEVRGFQLINRNPAESLTERGGTISIRYAATELLWYLSRTKSIKSLLQVAPRYAKFANDGHAMGAYGARWRYNCGGEFHRDQIMQVLDLLTRKPDTRQAVVTMWQANDLAEALRGEWNDIPCTVSMQFLLRNGDLDMIVTMRSNDAWLGLPYDMFCFCEMQRLVAAAIGVGVGVYYHQAGSMHIYAQNKLKATCTARNRKCNLPIAIQNPNAIGPNKSTALHLLSGCVDEEAILDHNELRRRASVVFKECSWFNNIVHGSIGSANELTRPDFTRVATHPQRRSASC